MSALSCRAARRVHPVPTPLRFAITLLLLFQAIALGLLQGLTEFLPVSSSGHLQAVPYLLGWDRGGLTFDVLVHAGTLIAVVWYFRTDLWLLATRSLGLGSSDLAERRQARLLVLLLAIGSVPAGAAGLLLGDVFEAAFSSPRAIAVFLYFTAVVLWGAERVRTRRMQQAAQSPREPDADLADTDLANPTDPMVDVIDTSTDLLDPATMDASDPGTDLAGAAAELSDVEPEPIGASLADDFGRGEATLRIRDAVVIGVTQALAIFPGISRSGATIAAGMMLGLSRSAAARFSFLLSIPVIVGATVYTVTQVGTQQPDTLPFGPVEIAAGMLAATLSGYWAIRVLLALVQRRSLLGFAWYVAIFGTILLGATFVLD